jgi:hypothetical protein
MGCVSRLTIKKSAFRASILSDSNRLEMYRLVTMVYTRWRIAHVDRFPPLFTKPRKTATPGQFAVAIRQMPKCDASDPAARVVSGRVAQLANH